MCRSVPQTPAACTRTRTSPWAGRGVSTSLPCTVRSAWIWIARIGPLPSFLIALGRQGCSAMSQNSPSYSPWGARSRGRGCACWSLGGSSFTSGGLVNRLHDVGEGADGGHPVGAEREHMHRVNTSGEHIADPLGRGVRVAGPGHSPVEAVWQQAGGGRRLLEPSASVSGPYCIPGFFVQS